MKYSQSIWNIIRDMSAEEFLNEWLMNGIAIPYHIAWKIYHTKKNRSNFKI